MIAAVTSNERARQAFIKRHEREPRIGSDRDDGWLNGYREALEDSPRLGPREPNNDMVICPTCTSQFAAIPVNIQGRLAALEAPPAIPIPSHVHCEACGRLSPISEYERRQDEWPTRYRVERHGLRWHVKCGEGTRTLMRYWSKHRAMTAAAELLTAFHDGAYVASRFGGGRYA